MAKLSVLQICNKPPYPPIDGGAIAMNNFTQGMQDLGVNVKVISINTPKHFVQKDNLPKTYLDSTNIEFFFVDTEIKVWDAFMNLFSNRSYIMSRFNNKGFHKLLGEHLSNNKYDIIQIETIFLKDYISTIRKFSSAAIILRAHNVEYKIWERLSSIETNLFKKIYLKILASRLKNEELGSLNSFDGLYTFTENDLNIFDSHVTKISKTSIPTGLDVTKKITANKCEPNYPTLFHIGALDWIPNQEGLLWFFENVWGKLRDEFPSLVFNIAGRRPPKWLIEKKIEGVNIIGEVESAMDFINSNSIMVVPLFSGSGIRIKIIEGMSLGKVVVSTDIGVEGLKCSDGIDVLLANSPQDFIEKIRVVLVNKSKLEEIATNAKLNISEIYSNKKLSIKTLDFFQSILGK